MKYRRLELTTQHTHSWNPRYVCLSESTTGKHITANVLLTYCNYIQTVSFCYIV